MQKYVETLSAMILASNRPISLSEYFFRPVLPLFFLCFFDFLFLILSLPRSIWFSVHRWNYGLRFGYGIGFWNFGLALVEETFSPDSANGVEHRHEYSVQMSHTAIFFVKYICSWLEISVHVYTPMSECRVFAI